MGVLPDGCVIELLSDFTQPGLRFSINDTQWTVRPERLGVETTNPYTDCGQFVSKVLSHLCWTPVKAIGTNILFVGDVASEGDLPQSFRLPVSQQLPATQRSVHIALEQGEVIVNIQLSSKGEELELSLNIHTEVKKAALSLTQSGFNEAARRACDLFAEHRRIATELASQVIHGEFVYEHANAE